MPLRTPDVRLADAFTRTTHTHPPPPLKPNKNLVSSPLSVCIIGASRGIGASIAYAYAHARASTLILAARSSSAKQLNAVEQRVNDINPEAQTLSLAVDITSDENLRAFATQVKQVGKVDVVVLNSGYSGPVVLKVTDGDARDFQDVFNVNVQGTYLVARYLIPILIASGGLKTFIAIGSFASCITGGHIANTAYCISKFAQARLIEFLCEQYGKEEDGGILSIAVHPGAVLTEMADTTTPESFRKYLTDDVSLCGAFCVWLCDMGERKEWLNGRLVSATWDTGELVGMRHKIEESDMLKFGFRLDMV